MDKAILLGYCLLYSISVSFPLGNLKSFLRKWVTLKDDSQKLGPTHWSPSVVLLFQLILESWTSTATNFPSASSWKLVRKKQNLHLLEISQKFDLNKTVSSTSISHGKKESNYIYNMKKGLQSKHIQMLFESTIECARVSRPEAVKHCFEDFFMAKRLLLGFRLASASIMSSAVCDGFWILEVLPGFGDLPKSLDIPSPQAYMDLAKFPVWNIATLNFWNNYSSKLLGVSRWLKCKPSMRTTCFCTLTVVPKRAFGIPDDWDRARQPMALTMALMLPISTKMGIGSCCMLPRPQDQCTLRRWSRNSGNMRK